MMNCLETALENGVARESLRLDLWRRSAHLYQAVGAQLKAAEAWLQAGDKNSAAEQFSAANDDFRAAELFYDCGRFSEALSCAEHCLEGLVQRDFLERISMLLVQAAALVNLGEKASAGNLLRSAREELSSLEIDNPVSQAQAGQAWESLARFGVRVKRPDLVRLGYEQALIIYGSDFNLQSLRSLRDYLAVVTDDPVLQSDLKSRRETLQEKLNCKGKI